MKILEVNQQTLDQFIAKRRDEQKNLQSDLFFYDNKIFKRISYKGTEDKAKRSKEIMNKLSFLSKMSERSNLLIAFPEEAIVVNNICVGYIMKTIQNAEGLDEYATRMKDGSIVDRIKVAINTCKLVEDLHNDKYGICIGDCHLKQFAVTNKGVCIFDGDTFGFLNRNIPADPVGMKDYQDPEALDENGRVKRYTFQSDWYSMSIITFKLLTGNISVFGGMCQKVKKKDRRKQKISILHREDVELYGNSMFSIKQFAWMSIKTQQAFLEIIEGNKRYSLRNVLEEQLNDLAYCRKHRAHYSKSRYDCCPMCHVKEKGFFECFSKQKPIKLNRHSSNANRAHTQGQDEQVKAAQRELKSLKARYDVTRTLLEIAVKEKNVVDINRLRNEISDLTVQIRDAKYNLDCEKKKDCRIQIMVYSNLSNTSTTAKKFYIK